MAAPKITYEGEGGTKTYVGNFEYTGEKNENNRGYIAIDSGETNDQGEKTLTLIPRSRIYSIENLLYEDDREKPTLTGQHR